MSSTLRLGILLMLIGSVGLGTYLLPTASAVPSNALPLDLVPVDTSMHDFMEGMFQSPYRRLKESIASEPKDNNGWKSIRSDLLILAEGSNLLMLRKQEKDQVKWDAFSAACKQDGEIAFKAAKQKKFAETRKAYESMLINCNDCHKLFDKGKNQLVP